MASESTRWIRRVFAYLIGGGLGCIAGVAAGLSVALAAMKGSYVGDGTGFGATFFLFFVVFWFSLVGTGLGLLGTASRRSLRSLLAGPGVGLVVGFAAGLGVAYLSKRMVAAMRLSASENIDLLQLASLASLACVVAGATVGAFRPQWFSRAFGVVWSWKRPILIVAGLALAIALPPLAWQWHWQSLPAQKVPRLLRDSSPAAQAELDALGAAAVPALIDALSDLNDNGIRNAAAMQLGKLKDPRAVEPLIKCVEERPLRVPWAINALSMLKDARAVEPLLACLQCDDNFVRCSAAKALAGIGGRRAFDALVEILNDEKIKQQESQQHRAVPEEGFRATAAAFVCYCGDARAFDVVLRILEDESEDPEVRAGAALSLAELGDRRAIPALTKAAARPARAPGTGIDPLKSNATWALERLNRR